MTEKTTTHLLGIVEVIEDIKADMEGRLAEFSSPRSPYAWLALANNAFGNVSGLALVEEETKTCLTQVMRKYLVELGANLCAWLRDMLDDDYSEVFAAIMREREQQDAKWGVQNHASLCWAAILGEELGELAQAILGTTFGGKAAGTELDELVQCAAVLVVWIQCLDRNNTGETKPTLSAAQMELTVHVYPWQLNSLQVLVAPPGR